MIRVDTIGAVLDNIVWCQYDAGNDVLYLQLVAGCDAATYSEETDDGLLLVRREDNDAVAGMTIVNWWKRFGGQDFPDSIHAFEQAVEPWARRVAA